MSSHTFHEFLFSRIWNVTVIVTRVWEHEVGVELDVWVGVGDVTLTLLHRLQFSSFGACHVEPIQPTMYLVPWHP